MLLSSCPEVDCFNIVIVSEIICRTRLFLEVAGTDYLEDWQLHQGIDMDADDPSTVEGHINVAPTAVITPGTGQLVINGRIAAAECCISRCHEGLVEAKVGLI
ncbi:hypothetical protein FCULG_00007344 [Fusarium culmorum]|uniref:Uncharacterized protein n=1 Tax=Fusarium culmorum TaxID=5516 RepID=A0A2T4H238_FUSCU|nr:hypothetical protein FCULG_00007344 [Fusarium culmorum]